MKLGYICTTTSTTISLKQSSLHYRPKYRAVPFTIVSFDYIKKKKNNLTRKNFMLDVGLGKDQLDRTKASCTTPKKFQ